VKTVTINGERYTCPPVYMPAVLKPRDERALRAAVEAGGAVVVVVSRDREVLAGHHGLEIARQLDSHFDPQVLVARARTPAEKLAAARGLAPRHARLTKDQRRRAIWAEIKAHPDLSDRELEAMMPALIGEPASDSTIRNARRALLKKEKSKQHGKRTLFG
jgi:hypothetical protein